MPVSFLKGNVISLEAIGSISGYKTELSFLSAEVHRALLFIHFITLIFLTATTHKVTVKE